MTILTFYKLSENYLIKLADDIEKQDSESIFVVEYSVGILTILIHKTSQEYVINRHSANQKIWYSSPLSGADYFTLEEGGSEWLNVKGEELEQKLLTELKTFYV
jgi:frataxin-like iron-binding protein CyaY